MKGQAEAEKDTPTDIAAESAADAMYLKIFMVVAQMVTVSESRPVNEFCGAARLLLRQSAQVRRRAHYSHPALRNRQQNRRFYASMSEAYDQARGEL